jgi:hypothetical protein
MAHDNELDWLRDHGVQVDHKGRIIVSLPIIPDGEVYDRDPLEEREPSIAELMRRDVDARHAGARGRRRRAVAKPAQSSQRAARSNATSDAPRIGRPVVGSEVRVYVQTSIAQRTRDILLQRGVTLADVFDDYARELRHVS